MPFGGTRIGYPVWNMATLKFVISRSGSPGGMRVVTRELRVDTESAKRPTTARVARLLARTLPAFRRRKRSYVWHRWLHSKVCLQG